MKMTITLDDWESPAKIFNINFTPPEPVNDDPGGGGDLKILSALYSTDRKIPESVIDKLFDELFEKACEQYGDM